MDAIVNIQRSFYLNMGPNRESFGSGGKNNVECYYFKYGRYTCWRNGT